MKRLSLSAILSLAIAPTTLAHTGHSALIEASNAGLHFLTSPLHVLSGVLLAIGGFVSIAYFTNKERSDK